MVRVSKPRLHPPVVKPQGGVCSKFWRTRPLSDAELLCLAVAQQLLGYSSETRWIRYARAHLTGMFPGIPQQSGYNKTAPGCRDVDLCDHHGLGQGHPVLA